jgi:hypothetical protein
MARIDSRLAALWRTYNVMMDYVAPIFRHTTGQERLDGWERALLGANIATEIFGELGVFRPINAARIRLSLNEVISLNKEVAAALDEAFGRFDQAMVEDQGLHSQWSRRRATQNAGYATTNLTAEIEALQREAAAAREQRRQAVVEEAVRYAALKFERSRQAAIEAARRRQAAIEAERRREAERQRQREAQQQWEAEHRRRQAEELAEMERRRTQDVMGTLNDTINNWNMQLQQQLLQQQRRLLQQQRPPSSPSRGSDDCLQRRRPPGGDVACR